MIRAYQKRADDLFGRLLDLYRENADPYNRPGVILPEDPSLLPSNLANSLTPANYWFCLCYYMRGQVKSVIASKAMAKLHETHPELFRFWYVADMQPARLQKLLVDNGVPWMARRTATFWVANAQDLAAAGITDILQLYQGELSAEVMYQRLCRNGTAGQRGFQRKMVDMLSYYLETQGLIEPFDHPTPVDFQAMRLVTAHNIIVHSPLPADGDFGSQEALARTRQLTQEFCRRHNVDGNELAAAIWLFGGEMCGNNPVGWMSIQSEYAGRSTRIEYVDLWEIPHMKAYDRSCRICPISSSCEWAISSKPYYVEGKIRRERRRADYQPPLTLF